MKNRKIIASGIVLFFVLCACSFFMLGSCKKKTASSGTLTVQFAGYVGNEPLSFTDSIYTDGFGNNFYFSTLQMYIAHFSLINSNDSLVEINPVAFFAYTEPQWMSFTVSAPIGSYKGIVFHVGLDTAQNNTNPEYYTAPNPLCPQGDMYWGTMGHRFVDLEGRTDTAGNFVNGTGLVYHVGTDTCYRSVTINGQVFDVVEGNNQMNLNLDILKIFYGPTDTLYFTQYPGTQSNSSDLPIAIKFANQITKAFSYSQ